MSLLVQAGAVIDPWLAAHPDYEGLGGAEVVEIRPRSARKASAVASVRGLLGPTCRLIVVGDDVSDGTCSRPRPATTLPSSSAPSPGASHPRGGGSTRPRRCTRSTAGSSRSSRGPVGRAEASAEPSGDPARPERGGDLVRPPRALQPPAGAAGAIVAPARKRNVGVWYPRSSLRWRRARASGSAGAAARGPGRTRPTSGSTSG